MRYIRERTEGWTLGTMASYAITDAGAEDGAEHGTVLGHIAIGLIDARQRSGRVSYWVLPEARGRRVASRALEAATRWAFRDLGLHRLELVHVVGNDASCGVARRCAYAFEGLLGGGWLVVAGTLGVPLLLAGLATDPAPAGEYPTRR
jgi:RimJ/RimL family protein N-acetyltransferase